SDFPDEIAVGERGESLVETAGRDHCIAPKNSGAGDDKIVVPPQKRRNLAWIKKTRLQPRSHRRPRSQRSTRMPVDQDRIAEKQARLRMGLQGSEGGSKKSGHNKIIRGTEINISSTGLAESA